MSLCALTLSLSLVLAAPQAPDSGPTHASSTQAEAGREIRHIPVREWIAPAAQLVEPPIGSFLDTESSGEPLFLLGTINEDRSIIDPNQIAELVRRIIDLDWDGANELSVEGMMLRTSGTRDEVQLTEKVVRDLTRAFVRNVRVRASLYRVPQSSELPATASQEELSQLVANHGLQLIWTAAGMCPSGNWLSLSKDRRTSYVHEVNVEVAQGAKIGDTETSSLFEGVRVAVEPHVLEGSTDLVLCAQFAFGEQRGPMQLRTAGNQEIPHLDVPDLDCNSGTMSGRIESGGALLLSVQGHEAGGGRMLLAVSAMARPAEGAGMDDVSVIPVSALVSPALRVQVRSAPYDLENNDCSLQLERDESQSMGFGPHELDVLQELMVDALWGGGDEGEEWLEMTRSHAVIKAAPQTREAAIKIILGLQQQFLHTARVDVETVLAGGHFGDSLFTKGQVSTGPQEAKSLHRITFPALIGRPHTVIRGHETTVIRENNVEIAQKSQITDPVVDAVFSGMVLSLVAYPQQVGWGADVDIDLRHVGSFKHRPAQTKDGGDLYLPTTNRSRFSHGGPVSTGQYLQLGDGPTVSIGDQSFRTQQTLRITLL